MTKFYVGVALNGNSAKCPMTIVALLGKLTLKIKIKINKKEKKEKKNPLNQSIKFHWGIKI